MRADFSVSERCFLALVTSGLWGREPHFSAEGTDWNRVLGLARSQTVTGLLWRAADLAGEDTLPEEMLAVMAAEVDACERRYSLIRNYTLRLIALYEERGLHPVLLKGLDSAALYDVPSLRESGDIDLYFPENEFLAAIPKEAVRSADNSWSFTIKGVEVELHDHILDLERPSARRAGLHILAESPVVRGDCNSLSPRVRLLLLSSHLLKHCLGRGCGLRQFCDYARARAAADYERQLFKDDCRALGMERWIAVLDNLCVRHLGMEGECNERYDRLADRLLRRILDEGNFGRESGRGKGAFNTFLAFLSNLGFSLRVAPAEAFHTVLSLFKGRMRKSSQHQEKSSKYQKTSSQHQDNSSSHPKGI